MKREYAFYKDINEPVENVSMAINGLFFPKGNVRDIHSVYRIVCKRDIKGKPGFTTKTYGFFNYAKELDFSLCKTDTGTRLNCIIREKGMTFISVELMALFYCMTLVDFAYMSVKGFSVPLFILWLLFLFAFVFSLFAKLEKYTVRLFEKNIMPQIREYLDVVNENLHGV